MHGKALELNSRILKGKKLTIWFGKSKEWKTLSLSIWKSKDLGSIFFFHSSSAKRSLRVSKKKNCLIHFFKMEESFIEAAGLFFTEERWKDLLQVSFCIYGEADLQAKWAFSLTQNEIPAFRSFFELFLPKIVPRP